MCCLLIDVRSCSFLLIWYVLVHRHHESPPPNKRAPRLTSDPSNKARVNYVDRGGQRPWRNLAWENHLNSLKYPISLAINTLKQPWRKVCPVTSAYSNLLIFKKDHLRHWPNSSIEGLGRESSRSPLTLWLSLFCRPISGRMKYKYNPPWSSPIH